MKEFLWRRPMILHLIAEVSHLGLQALEVSDDTWHCPVATLLYSVISAAAASHGAAVYDEVVGPMVQPP